MAGVRLALLMVTLAVAPLALAGEARDIVFVCPCQAEWAPTVEGEGELTLTFGVRSHRATRSGEVWLLGPWALGDQWSVRLSSTKVALGAVQAREELTRQRRSVKASRPEPGARLMFELQERVADRPSTVAAHERVPEGHRQEQLTLWPVGEGSQRLQFVDLLTDSDGDGVGDVNEELAGASPDDPADTPGVSTVDVLVIYDAGVREAFSGYPFTRLHHVMVLTNAIFVDSDTNVRLRTVGMVEVEDLGSQFSDLEERFGADMTLEVHSGDSCTPGCAVVGSSFNRGDWRPSWVTVHAETGAGVAAHELGHGMGLVHSARQGEASGAFRWSRGHYVANLYNLYGTVMTYGIRTFGVFSDPARECVRGHSCGVRDDRPDGANAAASLDLLRFQVAQHRAARRDTDGDGFVDSEDAMPNDPRDWRDLDGDGLGDNADPDDDNDGVADEEDEFPQDVAEWTDLDLDGVGDNADPDIVDPAPFRDPVLRAVVERALGKEPGAAITDEDLAGLTQLASDGHVDVPSGVWFNPFEQASAAGIRYLDGLELAVNIESLDLYDHDAVSDLFPLSGLTSLRSLSLPYNQVSDVSPLSGLTNLRQLNLTGNEVSDLSPLSGLSLEGLFLHDNLISEVSPVANIGTLQWLSLGRNIVRDVSPLTELTELRQLWLDGNPIADFSPLAMLAGPWQLDLGHTGMSDVDLRHLSELRNLSVVYVANNRISDLSPLAELHLLELDVSGTDVALDDVASLPHFKDLESLQARNLLIEDISVLAGHDSLSRLNLDQNLIEDVAPLATLAGLTQLYLNYNRIREIGPIVHGSAAGSLALLALRENPLGRVSVVKHIPTLRALGVDVWFGGGEPIDFPDAVLRALIAEALAGELVYVDTPVSDRTIAGMRVLRAFGVGVSDLTGLEAAENLERAFLGSNAITDLSPLANLPELEAVDLSENRVADISPLAHNPGLRMGDWLTLDRNPLSEASVNAHVPALMERGVLVGVDGVRLSAGVGGESLRFDTTGYFAAVLGTGVPIAATVGDTRVALAEIVDGALVVTPGRAGETTVTVTATDPSARSASLSFEVAVRTPPRVASQPSELTLDAGEVVTLDLLEVFATADGRALRYEAVSSDPDLARVTVVGGKLIIVPTGDGSGVVDVTVTATDAYGASVATSFGVTVEAPLPSIACQFLPSVVPQGQAVGEGDGTADPDEDTRLEAGVEALVAGEDDCSARLDVDAASVNPGCAGRTVSFACGNGSAAAKRIFCSARLAFVSGRQVRVALVEDGSDSASDCRVSEIQVLSR